MPQTFQGEFVHDNGNKFYLIDCCSLNRWQADLSETEVKISHAVTNFEFLYEPFFIATDNNPVHDERFIGYGYTRNTQVFINKIENRNKLYYYFNVFIVGL